MTPSNPPASVWNQPHAVQSPQSSTPAMAPPGAFGAPRRIYHSQTATSHLNNCNRIMTYEDAYSSRRSSSPTGGRRSTDHRAGTPGPRTTLAYGLADGPAQPTDRTARCPRGTLTTPNSRESCPGSRRTSRQIRSWSSLPSNSTLGAPT